METLESGQIRFRYQGASYANLFLAAKTDFAQNPASNYRKKLDLEQQVKTWWR